MEGRGFVGKIGKIYRGVAGEGAQMRGGSCVGGGRRFADVRWLLRRKGAKAGEVGGKDAL